MKISKRNLVLGGIVVGGFSLGLGFGVPAAMAGTTPSPSPSVTTPVPSPTVAPAGCRFTTTTAFTFDPTLHRDVVRTLPAIVCNEHGTVLVFDLLT